MNQSRQKYLLLIAGITFGILYGLLTRVLFGHAATLASITYLFVVPAILGIIPLIFVDPEKLRLYRQIIFVPWITLSTFLLTMLAIGLEEFICLMILALPFFIFGTLAAFVFAVIQIRRDKKSRELKLLTLLIIPFLLAPIEELIRSPSQSFLVASEVVIQASTDRIWNNIVEVKPIRETEFAGGFFNSIGIPRPVSATVDVRQSGGHRIGNFEGGLRFNETITEFEPRRSISFDIQVDRESVRPNVFDQHVLNGNYFTFVNATYHLTDLHDGHVKLTLSSSYRLTSRLNFYGKFWGDIILQDFQDRLLEVIRNRCELTAITDQNIR